MPPQTLSLVHLAQPPTVQTFSHPPLLLLIHGMGSNEESLMGIASQLDKRFKVVSARDPIRLRPSAYAWFHVDFTPSGPLINVQEAERSRLSLLQFVDELIEAYTLNPKRVYLMGFSQGAAMCLSLALTQPEKFAGVVAMSGRILPEVLSQIADTKALTGLPIFITHGTADPEIPIHYGRASRDRLVTLPVALTYQEYPMGHQVSTESLEDIKAWLAEQLGLDCESVKSGKNNEIGN